MKTSAVVLGVVLILGWWLVLRIEEDPSWPPPADAVTPAGAQAATAAFVARERPPRNEIAIDYAPATSSTVAMYSGGDEFFPRILDDVRRATSSVHVMEFGVKPGRVADQFVPVFEEQVRRGVPVRMSIDEFDSDASGWSKPMFDQLSQAGVQIVVNHTFPLDRDGLFDDQAIDWRNDELGRVDHRKMFIIDGRVGWVGGAGIEDHFADGRFHDVFVRVEGDIVRQMQAAFLTSFHALGGPLPAEPAALAPLFPEPADPGTIPTTLLLNVPGGFLPGTQAVRAAIEGAQTRLDIMNPYLTDGGMIDHITAAGERGAAVRLIVPGKTNNQIGQNALEHNDGRLLDAGTEIWEYPTVIHAKVVVADDVTIVGTINLDAWALYRNPEIALHFDSKQIADEAQARLVEDARTQSVPGQEPTGRWPRFVDWASSRLEYFL